VVAGLRTSIQDLGLEQMTLSPSLDSPMIEAKPQKRCLELSNLNKFWSFERLKVPDTFFWAKPPQEGLSL